MTLSELAAQHGPTTINAVIAAVIAGLTARGQIKKAISVAFDEFAEPILKRLRDIEREFTEHRHADEASLHAIDIKLREIKHALGVFTSPGRPAYNGEEGPEEDDTDPDRPLAKGRKK